MVNELIRKALHIFVCVFFLTVAYITNTPVAYLCFFGLYVGMLVLLRLGVLSLITKINRKSIGHHLIFVGCLIIFSFFILSKDDTAFQFGIITLMLADTLAIAGRPIQNLLSKRRSSSGKSILGSMIFFVVSLIIAFFLHINISPIFITSMILLAVAEHKSTMGFDNVIIPVFSFVIVHFIA